MGVTACVQMSGQEAKFTTVGFPVASLTLPEEDLAMLDTIAS